MATTVIESRITMVIQMRSTAKRKYSTLYNGWNNKYIFNNKRLICTMIIPNKNKNNYSALFLCLLWTIPTTKNLIDVSSKGKNPFRSERKELAIISKSPTTFSHCQANPVRLHCQNKFRHQRGLNHER